MWWSARRALSRALDELEQLRRDVEGLRYDLEDAKQRIQRLMWRTKERASTTTADPSASVPDASGSGGSTNGGSAAASANAGPGPMTDPISARLLARRRRLPVNAELYAPPPELRTMNDVRGAQSLSRTVCTDHVVFEDGRPCPNCGKVASVG
jgi:hypothetical protein